LLNLFLPNKHVQSIFELTPTLFRDEGIRGIVVDLDNTLVPWNVADAPEKVKKWLQSLIEADLQVVIFSNNNEERVKHFAEPLQIPYKHRAKKPLSNSFKEAATLMDISSGQLAVVGDQLLTDILGGNMFGAYTVLVVPIVESDAPITKFNRQIEKLIMNYFFRTGKLLRSVTDEDEASL